MVIWTVWARGKFCKKGVQLQYQLTTCHLTLGLIILCFFQRYFLVFYTPITCPWFFKECILQLLTEVVYKAVYIGKLKGFCTYFKSFCQGIPWTNIINIFFWYSLASSLLCTLMTHHIWFSLTTASLQKPEPFLNKSHLICIQQHTLVYTSLLGLICL